MKQINVKIDMRINIRLVLMNGEVNVWEAFPIGYISSELPAGFADIDKLNRDINERMLKEAITKHLSISGADEDVLSEISLSNITTTSFNVDWDGGMRDSYTFVIYPNESYLFTLVRSIL